MTFSKQDTRIQHRGLAPSTHNLFHDLCATVARSFRRAPTSADLGKSKAYCIAIYVENRLLVVLDGIKGLSWVLGEMKRPQDICTQQSVPGSVISPTYDVVSS